MSDYTLNIPDDVYEQVRQIAEAQSQSVEQVMLEQLKALLPALPPDEEAELAALQQLSDDALWTIAREQLPLAVQAQMQTLMDKNSRGTISAAERAELAMLVERGQRLTLRKSEASALLTRRGYRVTPDNLRSDA